MIAIMAYSWEGLIVMTSCPYWMSTSVMAMVGGDSSIQLAVGVLYRTTCGVFTCRYQFVSNKL